MGLEEEDLSQEDALLEDRHSITSYAIHNLRV